MKMMEDMIFKQNYTGLLVSVDGDIKYPNGEKAYTWVKKKKNGHETVRYEGKIFFVHRLVYETFLNDNKPLPDGYVVHHFNHDPTDNRLGNLVKLTKGGHNRLHKYGKHGKHLSEETKKKISLTKTGENNPCYGRTGYKHPMYGKLGADNPNSKPVIGVHKETGEVVEFAGALEAERVLGIGHISECCRGERKSAGGYYWKYA